VVGSFTGSPGVGVGEVTADNDQIRLCPVKVVVGFVELAELVADVVLGTRI